MTSARAPSASFWHEKQVLLTGHTGFKGAWLAIWLKRLGASVHGFALDPPTTPSLFASARVDKLIDSDTRAELRRYDDVQNAVRLRNPEIVFHLAAQSSVRESYQDPVGTIATNVLGTANLLNALRSAPGLRAVVVVTTDKVYENLASELAFRESDALGGHDPYSSSKAAVELVTTSFRRSFFTRADQPSAFIATARAGNVIGGGDWTPDRLVPDCVRAFEKSQPLVLRYPQAVRPRQHVLEPLSGYLILAERLAGPDGAALTKAWNFGPEASGEATVLQVAEMIAKQWGGKQNIICDPDGGHPHEASVLRLDSTQARSELGWTPRWSLERSVAATVKWHKAWSSDQNVTEVSHQQIEDYERGA